MRRFRLLTDDTCYGPLEKGKVYDSNLVPNGWCESVGWNADISKEDWEEVFDETYLNDIKDKFYERHYGTNILDPENGLLDLIQNTKPLHKESDLGHFSLEIIKSVFQSPSVRQGPSKSIPEFVTDCIDIAKELIKQLDQETK